MQERFDRIDERLSRMEGKLDNHLERVSRLEEALSGVKGHIKLIMSGVLAVISAAIATFFGGK